MLNLETNTSVGARVELARTKWRWFCGCGCHLDVLANHAGISIRACAGEVVFVFGTMTSIRAWVELAVG